MSTTNTTDLPPPAEPPETLANVMPLHGETAGAADYRSPPHNPEAEMALLGAILSNNRAYERVQEFLEAGHFAEPIHGRIYEACATLIDRGQLAAPVTLKNYFESAGILAEVGGTEKTLEEVGEKFGVTRERVRQIQNIALNKLRRMIEKLEAVKK